MNNEQFEVADEHGNKCYITVTDKFEHHYTKETMRIVRVEPSYMEDADAYTRIINEKTFKNYLKHKVAGPIGYVIFETGNREKITKLVRSETFSLEFETKLGWYRFNVNLCPYIALRAESIVGELKRRPTFEWKNEHSNKWEPAFIDHIEIYDEYWK